MCVHRPQGDEAPTAQVGVSCVARGARGGGRGRQGLTQAGHSSSWPVPGEGSADPWAGFGSGLPSSTWLLPVLDPRRPHLMLGVLQPPRLRPWVYTPHSSGHWSVQPPRLVSLCSCPTSCQVSAPMVHTRRTRVEKTGQVWAHMGALSFLFRKVRADPPAPRSRLALQFRATRVPTQALGSLKTPQLSGRGRQAKHTGFNWSGCCSCWWPKATCSEPRGSS